MTSEIFGTPIERSGTRISGPFRAPKNMLGDQSYDGHASIHDDATAQKLGFAAATIEGPTHFSQFEPLGVAAWGSHWFASGCLSASYKAACYEGEEVAAHLEPDPAYGDRAAIFMTKRDGTEVLRGTASVRGAAPTALDDKLAGLGPADAYRVILEKVAVGMKRPRVAVRMDPDQTMGDLYPFTLRQKLERVTERSGWNLPEAETPYGAPILPFEMVSVLVHHVAADDPWPLKSPRVDLFVDQEIRLVNGPVLAGHDYELEREVVGISQSRRTESMWIQTKVFEPGTDRLVALMLLNTASMKDSYPAYDEERLAIETRA
jgi:hypothetical protein